MSTLDDKVRRHLWLMFKLNMIEDSVMAAHRDAEPNKALSTTQHQEVARRVAEESFVLLKNESLLPLDAANLKTIAVIGANADAKFASGGGTANIKSPHEITALQGLVNRLGEGVKIIRGRISRPNRARTARSRRCDSRSRGQQE